MLFKILIISFIAITELAYARWLASLRKHYFTNNPDNLSDASLRKIRVILNLQPLKWLVVVLPVVILVLLYQKYFSRYL